MANQDLEELITGEIKEYPGDFIVLGFVFLVAIISFLFFSYDSLAQKKIVFSLSLAYFWWGVFHHWRKDSLTLRIVLEYLLLAIFGGIILIFLLLRA